MMATGSRDPRQINCIVFDFDRTLCSSKYFELLGPAAGKVVSERVFGDGSSEWADPWMRGELTSGDIAAYLSTLLSESEDEILSALREGCANLTFNPAVYEFAVRQKAQGRRKTALVTANMDVFTDVVAPAHGLAELFDVVLSTSDFGTMDKRVLWRRAFEMLGPEYSYGSALLIEDGLQSAARFESLGGWAHQYTDDAALRDWLAEAGLSQEP